MTSSTISKALREQVKRRAGFRCEYCQTSEWLNGIEGEIDHIIPRVEGGTNRSDNLCLACTACSGRATVEVLRLNHPLRVSARAVWVHAGYHPPV